MRYLKHIFWLVCLVFSAGQAAAMAPTIKAKLDSANLIMGKSTILHLEVVKDRDANGFFPLFAETGGNPLPYVGVCGDSVEISRKFQSDTIELGSGRTQINYNLVVQSFDSGFYYLPAMQYISGTDTVESNRVALKVLPVNVKADEDIAGFTGVAEPLEAPLSDKIPDVMWNYWWIILLAAIVLTVGIWMIIRYKKTGKFISRYKPQLPPYEAAVQALDRLKGENLWQQGRVEDYFVRLTDILRTYMAGRFQVSAPEMTTQQFLQEASVNPKLQAHAQEFSRLLELADLVKFARMQAMPEENAEAFKIVRDFVEQTKPTAEEQAAEKEKIKAEKKAADSKDKAAFKAGQRRSAGRAPRKGGARKAGGGNNSGKSKGSAPQKGSGKKGKEAKQ